MMMVDDDDDDDDDGTIILNGGSPCFVLTFLKNHTVQQVFFCWLLFFRN